MSRDQHSLKQSNSSIMTDEQVAEQTQATGPGTMLKEARVARGLSIEEVATRLNLKPANIQSLETEVFEQRISITFIRGYYKNYAKLLDVAPQQVLEAFDALNAAKQEPAKLQSFSRKVAKQASDDRLMLVSYVILAIIIAMVVVWWLQQSNSSEPISTSAIVTAEPATSQPQQEQSALTAASEPNIPEQVPQDEPELPAQVIEQPQQSSVDVQRQAEPGATEVTDSSPDDTVAEDVLAAATQDILPTEAELVFQFSADCWVNIVDATGEAIAYGVKVAGRTMPVSGVPPFEVTLGAPEAVQINFDGEAVDMSQFPKGRSAKFTLPLQ